MAEKTIISMADMRPMDQGEPVPVGVPEIRIPLFTITCPVGFPWMDELREKVFGIPGVDRVSVAGRNVYVLGGDHVEVRGALVAILSEYGKSKLK